MANRQRKPKPIGRPKKGVRISGSITVHENVRDWLEEMTNRAAYIRKLIHDAYRAENPDDTEVYD
jgi:hypothetical protein